MHAVPHTPVVVSQTPPACVPVAQSVSLVHMPQVPVVVQYGAAAVEQLVVAVPPLSAVQAAQTLLTQTGVALAQSVDVLQPTQVLVVVLQTPDVQSVVALQPRQVPLFVPVDTHTPVVHCEVAAQPVAPVARPHVFDAGSQTPLAQDAAPAVFVLEHVPNCDGTG